MEEFYKTKNCRIYNCDNLDLLKTLPDKSVSLVYSDILYNTGSKFNDYDDNLGTPKEAIEWYVPRINEMFRILKENGSIYIHCDWHLSSYMRVLMDDVFGYKNFKNEIIRQCTSAKNNSKNWGRIYDNILFYTKSDDYTWNEMKEPKLESDLISQYNKIDENGDRYTTIALHAKGATKDGETGKDWNSKSHGLVKLTPGRHWATSHSKMEDLDEIGLVEWSKNGNPRKKLYAKDYEDKHIQNIWDLKSIGGESYYKTKIYDTEKPRELLDRIIRASSNEGDIVADFFMGGGVTAQVSLELNRKFVGCDINPRACSLAKEKVEKIKNVL
jgi:adenine-specific DNA-methyltransferase